jgi:two-component system chemotaxis response regulator CheB
MSTVKSEAQPIRVLVVDDSATVRSVICRELRADPCIDVVGYARDGVDALEKIQELKPDVVTLDIEMPRLNGLETLRQLMATTPTRVIMVSSLTKQGADATLDSLDLGALDFVAKPSSMGAAGLIEIVRELIEKIKSVARSPLISRPRAPQPRPARPTGPGDAGRWRRRAVVIGSSTGGPQALRAVLTELPANLGVPVFVVQHMPPGFTRALAERLNTLCALEVEEARPGSHAKAGRILLAPGGFHMKLRMNGEVELTQDAPECSVRPAINVTMESVVRLYGGDTLGVVLTGMGHDGTRGGTLIKAAGGQMITESESTCVVYGMPRSVVEAGLSDRIVPLNQVPAAIVEMCRETMRASA